MCMTTFRPYVFLEDEAAEECGGLLRRQVVEQPVKHHLCQQQLVCTVNTQEIQKTLHKQV